MIDGGDGFVELGSAERELAGLVGWAECRRRALAAAVPVPTYDGLVLFKVPVLSSDGPRGRRGGRFRRVVGVDDVHARR